MSPVQFGKRVVGDKAFAEAVRNEEGGASVFGTRVRGAIPDTPSQREKRQSEFGARVVRGASAQDREGNEAEEGISIEELKNTLAENPTFFNSLYEAELARADEPREDALRIFLQHETGIKGGGRRDIIDDIEALLGYHQTGAEIQANRGEAIGATYDAMQQRMEENKLLADAPRIKSLKEREENLKIVEKGQRETSNQQIAATTEGQVNQRTGGTGQGEVGPGSDRSAAKPDGPVRPETQQPGPRGADSPKGVDGEDGTSRSQQESEGDEGNDPETLTVAELRDELSDEELAKVKGTGSDGAVLKADLVKAVKRARKSREK